MVFAHALREEAKSVSQHLEDVRKGREKVPTYSTSFIEIPKEFHSFNSLTAKDGHDRPLFNKLL